MLKRKMYMVAESILHFMLGLYEKVKEVMGWGTWLMLGLLGAICCYLDIYRVWNEGYSCIWIIYDLWLMKVMTALAAYTVRKEVLKK